MKGKASNNKPTVGDFFCGAGGFSEGFGQAGFNVRWGVDNWDPAVGTYSKNFPEARALDCDVNELSSDSLEPVDVVIGSPPCTHFSTANRGGNGDKRAGFQLVRRFFELVTELKPRYWVMENVPPLNRTLDAELRDGSIHLGTGTLAVPQRSVLLASDYATPQSRRRLFSGRYPMPEEDRESVRDLPLTLGQILKALPDPCWGKPSGKGVCVAPLYPKVAKPMESLRDHFEDAKFRLTREDLEQSRLQKEEHPWGGRMDWPDRLNRPSRTITATRTTSSRSTIVVDCPHHSDGERHYRSLTLRECATIQGFPITYQFWADSLAAKEALVGNAVAPPVARSIAEAILTEMGIGVPTSPRVRQDVELPPVLIVGHGRRHRYSAARRFRGVIPIERRPECRVQLENSVSLNSSRADAKDLRTKWLTRLYLGYAKEYRCYDVPHADALKMIARASSRKWDLVPMEGAFSNLLRDAKSSFEGLPDPESIQRRWAGKSAEGVTPHDVISSVKDLVDANFPSRMWVDTLIPRQSFASILAPHLYALGRQADAKPPIDLPVRTMAALAALSLACDVANSRTSSQLVKA